jgi:putative ABC transport system permease protein
VLAITLRSLQAHRRRLLATLSAVAIGVAFLAGTLVLTDTTRAAFDNLFAQANAGTDVVIRPQLAGNTHHDMGDSSFTALIDQDLVARVAAVDGVDRAEPQIAGYGRLIGRTGEALGGMGPPTVAASWVDDPRLNPFRLTEGRAPTADDEVVVDQASAAAGELRVGDTTTVQTPVPVTVTITGLVSFGERAGAGGMTFVGFTFDGAQRHVLRQPGLVSSIAVAATTGTGQDELAERIAAVLPTGVEAVTGDAQTRDQLQGINDDFLDFFTWFLLVFSGVAMLVAAFSIHNTFSILAAQRLRESALLRALGATRRQVLASSLIELVVIGVVASVVGLVGGIGLAIGLRELFALIGADLPADGLVIQSRTAVLAVGLGTVVTVAAGLIPARRSSAVAPLAALRDVAVDRSHSAPARLVAGGLCTVAGGAIVLHAALGGGEGVLARAAAGAVIGLIGVVLLGPVLAVVTTPAIGWPLGRFRLPGRRAAGTARRVTADLSRRNAVRNPMRTSGTAAALMIGVAVVTIFTVMAESAKASVADTLAGAFGGDLVVRGAAVPPALAGELAATDEVDTAVGLVHARARIDDENEVLSATDPAHLAEVLDLGVRDGSLETIGPHGLAVAARVAEDRGWTLGTMVPVSFADGTTVGFTVEVIYEQGGVVGDLVMTRQAWRPHAVQERDALVLIRLTDGVPLEQGRAAVERLTAPLAGAMVQDRDQYLGQIASEIDQQLVLVYVMLALAVVIALMGIANTLSLSIHERTRELGLLRAVGQTRRQVRSMVRGESVIIALFGTLAGVSLGLFLGWSLMRSASSQGIGTFSTAPAHLAVVATAGGLAGVLAAWRPARRAARLDVLAAIATD